MEYYRAHKIFKIVLFIFGIDGERLRREATLVETSVKPSE
jgi:hypothetical protein